jgi:hypothetical protein
MSNEDNERNVTCDGEGCDKYLFCTGSCSITDKQLDEILRILGWTVHGEDAAFCPHCKPNGEANESEANKNGPEHSMAEADRSTEGGSGAPQQAG